jgi:hypothetical protein
MFCRYMTSLFLSGVLTAWVGASGQAQSLEDRITAIMSQMTTAEKILQLHQEGGMNTADNATVKHYNANHRENDRTNNQILATDRLLNEDGGLLPQSHWQPRPMRLCTAAGWMRPRKGRVLTVWVGQQHFLGSSRILSTGWLR